MAELGEYENILVHCSISSTGVSPGLFPTFAGFTHAHTHTHVFCYHEADISLVERNVSTTIRQIAQLRICEFRICGILSFSILLCVF